MITEPQLTEIRNYLLSKKLPIDILIEVNDHFISQILDIQREENLGFEEAFEKVKENWKEELTFEAVLMGTSQVKFLTKIKRKQNLDFFLFALKIFVTILISSFLISNFGNVNIFIYFFSAVLIFAFSSPMMIQILNYKDFELSRKYKKNTTQYFTEYFEYWKYFDYVFCSFF